MSTHFAEGLSIPSELDHVRRMYEQDATLELLGITITQMSSGLTEGEFTVGERHCNGFGVAQGGILFAFADCLFAGACNAKSTTPNVASQVQIHYLAPAKLGRTIRGTARETSVWGKNGLSDVTLYDDETVIAEFRGHSRMVSRPPTAK
ncbi:hotdog fold thioesterase [Corynebacterium lehmanniae]|nr:hotdog fold thioesterase [Corynebacterium lehmanniae]